MGSIVFSAIGLINNVGSSVDAEQNTKLTEIFNDHYTGILIVSIVGIVLTVVEMFGAVIFNFYMVALYVVWSILELILGIVLTKSLVDELVDCVGNSACLGEEDVAMSDAEKKTFEDAMNIYLITTFAVSATFTFLWVYPSVMLAVEIKKGIMTKATYPREEMSCCCV